MSLYTGKKIHFNEWDELPIDDDVIHQVEQLAAAEKQVWLSDRYPMLCLTIVNRQFVSFIAMYLPSSFA